MKIDEGTVAEYAEVLRNSPLSPALLFFDGAAFWLAYGFHRYHASPQADFEAVHAEIHTSTRRDAVLYGVDANAARGLRRSNSDKRRAVHILLEDLEWAQWSDREIARQCGVSDKPSPRAAPSICGIPQIAGPPTFHGKSSATARPTNRR